MDTTEVLEVDNIDNTDDKIKTVQEYIDQLYIDALEPINSLKLDIKETHYIVSILGLRTIEDCIEYINNSLPLSVRIYNDFNNRKCIEVKNIMKTSNSYSKHILYDITDDLVPCGTRVKEYHLERSLSLPSKDWRLRKVTIPCSHRNLLCWSKRIKFPGCSGECHIPITFCQEQPDDRNWIKKVVFKKCRHRNKTCWILKIDDSD